MKSNTLQIEKNRRSIYHLGRKISLNRDAVIDLIQKAIKLAPTPFNNQAVRAVIVVGNSQDKLWDIIRDSVKAVVNDDAKYEQNFAPRIVSFKQGYGTVLFYNDRSVIARSEKNVPAFAPHNFREWAEQAQGNAQSAVWDALAEQKIGASIHHYASLLGQTVSNNIAKQFDVPKDWHLRTEMVFGSVEKPAHPKTFISDQKRFKVFK